MLISCNFFSRILLGNTCRIFKWLWCTLLFSLSYFSSNINRDTKQAVKRIRRERRGYSHISGNHDEKFDITVISVFAAVRLWEQHVNRRKRKNTVTVASEKHYHGSLNKILWSYKGRSGCRAADGRPLVLQWVLTALCNTGLECFFRGILTEILLCNIQ